MDAKKEEVKTKQEKEQEVYAAIDLGTNSCRLVLASPTPSAFRIIETFSKVTRLGEGIIKENMLSSQAIRRTTNALKVCAGIINEYAPIKSFRYVATQACRRAKNHDHFIKQVKKETGLDLEIISTKEEARLAVVGCLPLLNRNIKRALVFDIGGGSTEISLARITNSGKTFIEGFVSLPYGVVTISEALPGKDMTTLAYDSIISRTHGILTEFEEQHNITDAIKNHEIQVIGTSGTVTVLGAVHLNLPRYNRLAVDGLSIAQTDLDKTINKIKRIGEDGRKRHACIGPQKADLTMAGCAIIEGISSFWPISEISIADRGIREGMLLDMMHKDKPHKPRFNKNKYNKNPKRKYWKQKKKAA